MYVDKNLKGFGVRVAETGAKSFVLIYGTDRKRVKLGDVARDRGREAGQGHGKDC